MGSDRRKQLLLGGLVFALFVVAYNVWPRTSAPSAPSSNRSRPAPRGRAQAAESPLTAPDVKIEALTAERSAVGETERNLFQFKPKAPPPPPPAPERPVAPVARAVPAGPPAPLPVAPITLKFIGIIDRNGQKIAVLSDSAGHVDYGIEGAIIGGRYRVLKIGVESIEMSHLDGRGRQTIRLTGS
jgi:hypothetical protein